MQETLPPAAHAPDTGGALRGRWHEVWGQRQPAGAAPLALADLIALDGFDTLGGVSEAAWRANCARLATCMALAPGESLFDVGCGAGAFLYPFYKQGQPVAGLDYAANLVQVAQRAMPGAAIAWGEAATLDIVPPADVVVSYSAFFYFPDLAYAATTLRRMTHKARRLVAVLDVPDRARQAAALAARQAALGSEEYARRYAGLEHLYFDRGWFGEVLAGLDCTIEITDQAMAGYRHAAHRFDVLIRLDRPAGAPAPRGR